MTVIFGTRPEIIKLAPVIHAARERGHRVKTVLTGQHRDMAIPLLRFFRIQPDLDLDVMTPNQSLSSLTQRILEKLNSHQDQLESDYFIVQGDTTSAFAAAYWSFCNRIPVCHVEAGLRTYDLRAPFPEEANRQLIGRLANLHFAPTTQAAQTLREEKVPAHAIRMVGNTAIDSLHYVRREIGDRNLREIPELEQGIMDFVGEHRLVLVTAHRRESFGDGFEGICRGIRSIADRMPDVRIIYPVHPNPNVRAPVEVQLGGHPGILLCNPLPYVGFAALMNRADALLTDSGGVQEEGPSLLKPIIVMREKTERPEGVEAGFSRLVGTEPAKIFEADVQALDGKWRPEGENPYGDGKASGRIIQAIEDQLGIPARAA